MYSGHAYNVITSLYWHNYGVIPLQYCAHALRAPPCLNRVVALSYAMCISSPPRQEGVFWEQGFLRMKLKYELINIKMKFRFVFGEIAKRIQAKLNFVAR
jgi:pyrimidine deaminase RibD-like protein